MSIRVDTTPLIAGAIVVGHPGLGVLAQAIPGAGQHGPGYGFSSIDLPADVGKEIRAPIVSWPTLGTLTPFEDTSFVFDGPDGAHRFVWQLYVDGVTVGTPQTVTITVG